MYLRMHDLKHTGNRGEDMDTEAQGKGPKE